MVTIQNCISHTIAIKRVVSGMPTQNKVIFNYNNYLFKNIKYNNIYNKQ